MGLDHTTFALIFEELSKGWMSLTGVIGTHHVMSAMISGYGTEEQKRRFLPRMAEGALRGGLALTEPDAGSDVQNIQTSAVRTGEEYVLNGTKMFITNGQLWRYGFALLAKTDPGRPTAGTGASPASSWRRGPTTGFEVGPGPGQAGLPGPGHLRAYFRPISGCPPRQPGGRPGRPGVPGR